MHEVRNTDSLRINFSPSGQRGRVRAGTRLDQAAAGMGVDLQSVCGGQGKCGKCRVRVFPDLSVDSKTSPSSPILSEFTSNEKDILSANELSGGWRLACQTYVLGNAVVEIPPESSTGRQVICKAPGGQSVALDPTVYRQRIEQRPSGQASPHGAWEQIAMGLDGGAFGPPAVPDLPMLQSLPPGEAGIAGPAAAVLRKPDECIAFFSEPPPAIAGVALDIGTTTLAAYLCDLETGNVIGSAGAINPQVAFGEDVISRIVYARRSAENRVSLKKAVVGAINSLVEDLSRSLGVPASCMLDMTCVGNSCMHHLFLGIDPAGMGQAPFVPVLQRPLDFKARDLGIQIAPGAWVHLLPIVAGFVGADTMGVLMALEPHRSDENVLIIDVGTNGEIIVGNRKRLICASCATGPALEGATLRHGMRAAPGAIEHVGIDPESLNVTVSVINEGSSPGRTQKASGICGSGIIDAVAQMFLAGVIEKNGNLNRRLGASNLIRDPDGVPVFVLVPADHTVAGRDICITQDDVRAVQMAKGAIHAAVRILMKELGIASFDQVLLAGAFGSRINPSSALAMGLFPACPVERVRSAGNAAGDGARFALLSRLKRIEAAQLARQIQYVELTEHPDFQREFAYAMWFPHMKR